MLHLLTANPLTAAVAERIAAGDVLVLQSAAIWSAVTGHIDNRKLQLLLERGCHVRVMQDLLTASGIDPQQLLPGVDIVDYPGLVELTVAHYPIQTWC